MSDPRETVRAVLEDMADRPTHAADMLRLIDAVTDLAAAKVVAAIDPTHDPDPRPIIAIWGDEEIRLGDW